MHRIIQVTCVQLAQAVAMNATPIPGSYMLSAKLSCLFMAPDGALQSWDVPLDVPADASQKKKRKNKKRRFKNKKRKQKMKRAQLKPSWKSSCPEHIPEKVFPTGPRDNGEWSWRCAVCKADL